LSELTAVKVSKMVFHQCELIKNTSRHILLNNLGFLQIKRFKSENKHGSLFSASKSSEIAYRRPAGHLPDGTAGDVAGGGGVGLLHPATFRLVDSQRGHFFHATVLHMAVNFVAFHAIHVARFQTGRTTSGAALAPLWRHPSEKN